MTQAIGAIASVAPLAPAFREPAAATTVPATPAPAIPALAVPAPAGHAAEAKSDPAATGAVAAQDKAAPAPSTAPPPLKLTVAKSVSGVFVYTLTDPGSGAVVAVIPLVKLQSSDTGTQVDQKV